MTLFKDEHPVFLLYLNVNLAKFVR